MRRFFTMVENQKGWSIVEVLIAVAILALASVAFLGGLSASSKAVFTADELQTSRNIAVLEMEYVVNADYITSPWIYDLPTTPPSWDTTHTLSTEYTGYNVNVTANPLTVSGADANIQEISVTVSHNGEAVITLRDYKINR